MASKKDNIKALFRNTRTRIIIVFTAIIIFAIIFIGAFKIWSLSHAGADLSAGRIKRAPTGIHSIPGALDPTNQYAALQEQQNTELAQTASKSGASAIPTIVRTYAFGEGVEMIGPKEGQAGVGFSTLALTQDAGAQQSLWIQSLKDAQCSKASFDAVVSEGGSLKSLRAGCSCAQLRDYGYKLAELNSVCSCSELKVAGFSATDLKNNNYTVEQLKRCGFSACEVRGAEFTAEQMKNAGFTDGELRGAGFSPESIDRAGGIPSTMTAEAIRQAGCNVEALKRLKEQGVSAAAIVRISGCSAAQLKAAGFSASDLKAAGFTAAQLSDVGIGAAELNAAGFSPRELLDAGFTAADLAAAGFTAEAIQAAAAQLPNGVTADQLKKAGCSVAALNQARLSAVSASAIKRLVNCSAAQLAAAGFLSDELAAAGFTPQEMASKMPSETANVAADAIRAAGCDVAKLISLRAKGVTAEQIHRLNGCSAAALKAAGYSADELAAAGFTPAELLAARFTAAEIKNTGLVPSGVLAGIKTSHCSVESLRAARALGVSVESIRKSSGCSAAAMRAAGFTAAELATAGFSAAELKAVGFSVPELKAAGFGANELKNIGFNAGQLQGAGFSKEELIDAGVIASPTAPPVVTPTVPSSPSAFPAVTLPGETTGAVSANAAKNANSKLALQKQTQHLKALMSGQQKQMVDQRYLAEVKQRGGMMMGAAKQALQEWKKPPKQVFIQSSNKEDKKQKTLSNKESSVIAAMQDTAATAGIKIKAGDILFAVIDTAVNTDEPGPILATIVAGRLKGSKLIGSFVLPADADKMVISFKTISVPEVDHTQSINAYAIDPDTARTALSSETNHHYLARYGALFASSFLEGFSSAIQSANTTVSIGGTGGVTDTTVSTLSRSSLDNALIGLGQVGKDWSKTAQKEMNRPTTVQVYSGTGIGVLFTQDTTI